VVEVTNHEPSHVFNENSHKRDRQNNPISAVALNRSGNLWLNEFWVLLRFTVPSRSARPAHRSHVGQRAPIESLAMTARTKICWSVASNLTRIRDAFIGIYVILKECREHFATPKGFVYYKGLGS
jgi:hypothetical protein